MKVVWTRKASRHLRAAYEYWAQERSEDAAGEMLDRIFNAVEILARFPEAGRPGRIAGTRELVVSRTPFIAAYRIRRSKIEILSLLHGARKWPRQF
jgi:toxin ParE1/3/4